MHATARKQRQQPTSPAKAAELDSQPLVAGELVPARYEYREIETALAAAFDVSDFQETSFRARLKHFRKLGILTSTPGKGGRIRYSGDEIFRLMVALELAELNIDPALIVGKILTQTREWDRSRFPFAILLAKQAVDKDMWAIAHIKFMSGSWTAGGREPPVRFEFAQEGVDIRPALRDGERLAVFNLSFRIRRLEAALKEVAG